MSTATLLLVCWAGGLSQGAADATKIFEFNQPLSFSYLAWENKVKVEDGVLVLNAEGLTPKGGGGTNVKLDLSAWREDCPAIVVKLGPKNTMKGIKLMLRESEKNASTWNFTFPKNADGYVTILPEDGASFATGNDYVNPKADPAKIMQWQLIGDWSGEGLVDVRVKAVVAVKLNAEIRKMREAQVTRIAEAKAEALRQRMAAREKYAKPGENSPVLQSVYAAGPDLLALTIRQGRITALSKLSEYSREPGDEKNSSGHIVRNGKDIGLLIGPPGKESGVVTNEEFAGDPLLLAEVDDAANFTVTSSDDPAYAKPVRPLQVSRKSKPDDWQMPIQPGIVIDHRIYLKLPTPLVPGKHYSVATTNLNTLKREIEFRFEPENVWSESVHVNQIGFRPDDPSKTAYLSVWAGNGGAYKFPEHLPFRVVDTKSNKTVLSGTVGDAWAADKVEKMDTERNFSLTNVSPIDFSALKTPGTYRLVVERVGTSYPFEISDKVWEKAFWTQMKGFYNERSGVDLGPPYTDFVRPAGLRLGVRDSMPIYQSTFSIIDGNPSGKGGLPEGSTGKLVPEAWGGYHDAGDWNPRRMDHMTTTTFWQLELLQLFPEYFSKLKLNIPNDNPGPDLLKECLFELDCFRRLQMPDGGCRWGIETDGDPFCGEVSWKQHMTEYVYAPDILSSYLYAAIASRAAQVMESYDKKAAALYRDSALRAMKWAEGDRAKRLAKGTWDKIPNRKEDVYNARNLAAVCLLALTKDAQWDQIFLSETVLKSAAPPHFGGNNLGRDAAFTYARLPEGQGNEAVKINARLAVIYDAEQSLVYQANNAFNIVSADQHKPLFIGFYSNPHGAVSLARAHYLTHDARFLTGAVKGCVFSAGGNPSNLVYTSGLGTKWARPMNLDAIATGQKTPIGLTPYGPIDLVKWPQQWITWPLNMFGGDYTPSAYEWPTPESYWDVRFWPSYCEFCVDQTMGPNAFVWGYLAARR
jgi:endoglucanase